MISDEAVEAAAKSIARSTIERESKLLHQFFPASDFKSDARAALEAAAPHMLADLAKKAEDPTAEDMDNYFIDQSDVGGWLRSMVNPHRSQSPG